MANKSQIIRIICCIFPNGEPFFMEAVLGPVYLSQVIKVWKEKNPGYRGLNVSGGAVELWMMRGDFEEKQENNIELPEDFHENLKKVENRPDTN